MDDLGCSYLLRSHNRSHIELFLNGDGILKHIGIFMSNPKIGCIDHYLIALHRQKVSQYEIINDSLLVLQIVKSGLKRSNGFLYIGILQCDEIRHQLMPI